MTIEKQVCSADQARSLKKLGISQESLFYWQMTPDVQENIVNTTYRDTIEKILPGCNLFYSAFTVAELGVMLGNEALNIYPSAVDTISEAIDRAENLIYLLEKGELSALLCSDRLEA